MNHKIIKSIGKIAAVLMLLFLAWKIDKIEGTSSQFSNREISSGNSFTAGTWVENNSRIQMENILAPSQEDIVEESVDSTSLLPAEVITEVHTEVPTEIPTEEATEIIPEPEEEILLEEPAEKNIEPVLEPEEKVEPAEPPIKLNTPEEIILEEVK